MFEKPLQPSCCLLAARAGKALVAEGAGAGASASGGTLARLLSPRCVPPRLVAELQDALDDCAERQRQLEQSMRVSRRLLRAWYADPGTTRLDLPRALRTPVRALRPGGRAQRPLPNCRFSVLPLSLQAVT